MTSCSCSMASSWICSASHSTMDGSGWPCTIPRSVQKQDIYFEKQSPQVEEEIVPFPLKYNNGHKSFRNFDIWNNFHYFLISRRNSASAPVQQLNKLCRAAAGMSVLTMPLPTWRYAADMHLNHYFQINHSFFKFVESVKKPFGEALVSEGLQVSLNMFNAL